MLLQKICSLLLEIDRRKPANFAGMGLIFYEGSVHLPIAPLKLNDPHLTLPVTSEEKLLAVLLEISKADHYYHDGFHLINEAFALTHLSQYFAAPVISSPAVEYQYGSRYRTAFYGSFIPHVVACAAISNTHEPVIFVKGSKVNPFNDHE